ncbi:hypothetical protein K474DRAFT_1592187 [Panus rudis PR-1116 ss-1]|nr:hypothetical protein K474DRAFT_1592187 [Panus rudis PR-1116 ss-1]
MENVMVPSITLEPPPNKQSSGELEDWEEQTAALFEWVGMAGFGSDRLKSRDKVDPYIAVYDPPFEMREETVTRVRWNGLLSDDLMQRIMDVALSSYGSSIYPLMAIVGHGVPIAPVGINTRNPWSPCRVPRAESEDSWSLIINRSGPNAVGRWLLCESLGQWDARN